MSDYGKCGQCGLPLAPVNPGIEDVLGCSNEDCAGPCQRCGGPRSDVDGDGLADCLNPACAMTLKLIDWSAIEVLPELGGMIWVPPRLVSDVRPQGAPSGIIDRWGREVYVLNLADGRRSWSVPGMRLDTPADKPEAWVREQFDCHQPEGWAEPPLPEPPSVDDPLVEPELAEV